MGLRLNGDVDNRCGAVVLNDTYRDVMGLLAIVFDEEGGHTSRWVSRSISRWPVQSLAIRGRSSTPAHEIVQEVVSRRITVVVYH
jgi:hypothetical protein